MRLVVNDHDHDIPDSSTLMTTILSCGRLSNHHTILKLNFQPRAEYAKQDDNKTFETELIYLSN